MSSENFSHTQKDGSQRDHIGDRLCKSSNLYWNIRKIPEEGNGEWKKNPIFASIPKKVFLMYKGSISKLSP
jgi:hypothetical protein